MAVLQGRDRRRDSSNGVAVQRDIRQKQNRPKPLLIWLETVRNACLVAHTGIEPVISALRGRRPWPLDECALLELHHNPAAPICQVRFWPSQPSSPLLHYMLLPLRTHSLRKSMKSNAPL